MTRTPSGRLADPPATMPWPGASADEATFWAHCDNHRLAFQACGACGVPRHPPMPICPACRVSDVTWRDAPVTAEVYSFTIVHRASHPSVEGSLPYCLALVTFPGLGDVRLLTNIIDAAWEDIKVGMPVARRWRRLDDGQWLPVFVPLPGAECAND